MISGNPHPLESTDKRFLYDIETLPATAPFLSWPRGSCEGERRASKANFIVNETTGISCLCPSGKSPMDNISTDLVASSIPARLKYLQLDSI
jgi:hypothetical protein